MKVKMKKAAHLGLQTIILASALQVHAGTIAPTDAPTAATVNNAGCAFVGTNSTFTFTPSRNVGVAYNCDSVAVAVNAGNTKGKFTYGGSSNGGSVKQCGTTAVNTANGYTVASPGTSGDGCS